MSGVRYEAVVLVSFGGPERPEDVRPFLENVARGRDIPAARLDAVAEHYLRFGGVSPINDACRRLLSALRAEFDRAGLDLPWFWGNRNWHPYLADTVAELRDAGVGRALAFVTSPFGSASSCRQYLEDIARARATVGPGAPIIDKLRHYHDHPGYVAPHADAVRASLAALAGSSDVDGREGVRLVFTAHSVPVSMNDHSGPAGGRYLAQLRETARLVADRVGADDPRWRDLTWDLVWQSRSGPPAMPWLEPDVNRHLEHLAASGVTGVVVSPISFISDHLEVVWDLDHEAAATASRLGLRWARAATPDTDPRFVAMVRDLVRERLEPDLPRARLGELAWWDECPENCCGGSRPPARPSSG
jgi:ferrochelatase